MELAGICDIIHDYSIRVAMEKGYRVFDSTPDRFDEMKASGVRVEGLLENLLEQADVVVDCTPKKIAAGNRALYAKAVKRDILIILLKRKGLQDVLSYLPIIISVPWL